MADTPKLVHVVFPNQRDAEQAFDYLAGLGYEDTEVNVLMSETTRSCFSQAKAEGEKHPAGTMATEGMGVGGAIGTAVGATIAAIAAIGTSVALPGVGLIVAGPLAAALAGGGAGAVTGGLIGALVGAGMTEQNAEAYEEALRNGGVALAVTPRNSDDSDAIEKKFKEFNGENVCCC